jgi:hypothetical protein
MRLLLRALGSLHRRLFPVEHLAPRGEVGRRPGEGADAFSGSLLKSPRLLTRSYNCGQL